MPTTSRQAEVWWADLPDPLGWRPVLILTRTSAIDRLNAITVAPLTRTIRDIPTSVLLDVSDGVPQRSAVMLDAMATIEKDRLVRRIATLSADRMNEVFEAIHAAFEMPW